MLIFLILLFTSYVIITNSSSNIFFQPRNAINQQSSSPSGNNILFSKSLLKRYPDYPLKRSKTNWESNERIPIFSKPTESNACNPRSDGDNHENHIQVFNPQDFYHDIKNSHSDLQILEKHPITTSSPPLLAKLKSMKLNKSPLEWNLLTEGSIGLQEEGEPLNYRKVQRDKFKQLENKTDRGQEISKEILLPIGNDRGQRNSQNRTSSCRKGN